MHRLDRNQNSVHKEHVFQIQQGLRIIALFYMFVDDCTTNLRSEYVRFDYLDLGILIARK